MYMHFYIIIIIDNTVKQDKAYDGQVRLCPPSAPSGMATSGEASVSMGLVQIYLNGDWGQINQYTFNHTLGSHEADSICRQLGYTNAIATITQGAAARLMSTASVVVNFEQCYKREKYVLLM